MAQSVLEHTLGHTGHTSLSVTTVTDIERLRPPERQGNGSATGLSLRTITDLARWYIESADAQRQDSSEVDATVLAAGLRQALAEMVLAEFIEIEFERMMVEVFRV